MRFYNTGKGADGAALAAPGVNPGAAIVNFPGSGFYQVVEVGQYVDLPDNIALAAIKAACPALVPESDLPAKADAPAPKAAKADDKGDPKADAPKGGK